MSRHKRPNADWVDASKDPLLTTEQAAKVLSVAPDTLKYWRVKRWMGGPRFVRFGRGIVRYLTSDLKDYMASCRVTIVKGAGYAERNAGRKTTRSA